MRVFRFVTLVLLAAMLPLAAWSQSSSPQFDPAQSSGLFVGVNEYVDDTHFEWLRFAVDDAVDQAHLFVFELGLIAPQKVTLALSGVPAKPASVQNLRKLQQKGATVVSAERESIRDHARRNAASAQANGLLIFSVCGHGYQNSRGIDFIVASDSRYEQISETSVEVSWLQNVVMAESPAPRRVAFIDACRSRDLNARSIRGVRSSISSRPVGSTATVSERLGRAILQHRGQVVFRAATAGVMSYETDDGNGVFTGALLAALRGDASGDSDGLLTAQALADHMNQALQNWAASQGIVLLGIQMDAAGAVGRLPLAEAAISALSPTRTPEPTSTPTPTPRPTPAIASNSDNNNQAAIKAQARALEVREGWKKIWDPYKESCSLPATIQHAEQLMLEATNFMNKGLAFKAIDTWDETTAAYQATSSQLEKTLSAGHALKRKLDLGPSDLAAGRITADQLRELRKRWTAGQAYLQQGLLSDAWNSWREPASSF
jgi:hypothetical protein